MVFMAKWKMAGALQDRDTARLGELIDAGVDVNMTLSDGATPLHIAADMGAKDVVTFLISRGAKVNALKDYKWAPIHDAAYKGHFDVVVELMKAGADPNLRTHEGRTAYGWAVVRKQAEVAEFLSPYMKKAVEIAQENNMPVPDAPSAPQQGWSLLSESQIAHAETHAEVGYRITDIFNFRARERIRIVNNLATGADQAETRSFDDITEKKQLEDALAELKKRGGRADAASIGGIDKKKLAL